MTRAIFAAMILVLATASVAASQAPQSAAPALRGVAAPSEPKADAPTLRTSPWGPGPDLTSPGLQSPAAPRLEGLSAGPLGGSACRTTCAASLYACQGGDAGDHCQQTWSACVLACPAASGAL
jgi:hypothetical protein